MNQLILRFGVHIALLACLCLGMPHAAWAADASEAGTVVNMQGSLAAKGADGSLRALAIGDKVLAGDALFTSKDGYARIKFADGGIMSLRPNSHFKIDSFNFDEKEPGRDKASFDLVKGGLRAVSGLIGHRGDPDSYGIKTRTATIGIRGTQFGLLFCQGDCASIVAPDGTPASDGLHVDVTGGIVQLQNEGGTLLLNAGQFAYVNSPTAAPVVVPPSQGISAEIPASMSMDKSSTTPTRGVPPTGPGGKGGGSGNNPGGSGAPANTCPTG